MPGAPTGSIVQAETRFFATRPGAQFKPPSPLYVRPPITQTPDEAEKDLSVFERPRLLYFPTATDCLGQSPMGREVPHRLQWRPAGLSTTPGAI